MCVCAKRRVDLRSEAQEWGGVWVMCAHRNEGAKRRGELVTATRVDLRRDAQEWGGVWVMCAHGFPVTTDNPPPSSRLNLLQAFCILQTRIRLQLI